MGPADRSDLNEGGHHTMKSLGQAFRALAAAACLIALPVAAQEKAASIPEAAIGDLDSALAATDAESSPARQRLALKRVLRDGEKLIEGHPDAANRFEILAILFRGQQALFAMDDSPRNREAVLDVAGRLAKAPDDYAALRLDADLLLSQAEVTRQGGDVEARGRALGSLVERYRDTPVEGKVLRIAMVMALELGDQPLIDRLRETMAERFATDLDMIAFQREKLGGQVFGVPFAGVFERSDGRTIRFPMDALGRTTALVFWSKDDAAALEEMKCHAAAMQELRPEIAGRRQVISVNVDDLPDAGESILRGLGVEWPALKLPGGRSNPYYRTFAMGDPRLVHMSPTGQVAMTLEGTTKPSRSRAVADKADYVDGIRRRLAWLADSRYVAQISSVLAGDFLVVDPTAAFDPALPPELKAAASAPLVRTAASVPAATCAAIQECFLAPPLRYRAPFEELRTRYHKAEALCREAIAAHPAAPDLWIVRNRRIIALLNLWKLDADLAPFDQAVEESRAALASALPPGADVVPRFCLAREALRQADADPRSVIEGLLEAAGRDSGPSLAVAAVLALDVADRPLHECYRDALLEKHTEHPLMWTMVSFLLDRYHRYWLYQVPFAAGWTYGRREDHYASGGEPDATVRSLEAEFRTLDGQPFRIPHDTAGTWTILAFMTFDAKLQNLYGLARFVGLPIAERPLKNVRIVVAEIGSEADTIRGLLAQKPANFPPCDFPILMVPGGLSHPVVSRLGILDEDRAMNLAVLRPDGTIAAFISGLTISKMAGGRHAAENVIMRGDEQAVFAALERGDLEQAKNLAFTFAPPFDPAAKDGKGTPKPSAAVSLPHLRSRGRVYAALGQWDAALADAEEVVSKQTAIDGSLSLRSAALDEAERFRDECAARRSEGKPERPRSE
jgi:tetratricopeptide (TPR) repeat protein